MKCWRTGSRLRCIQWMWCVPRSRKYGKDALHWGIRRAPSFDRFDAPLLWCCVLEQKGACCTRVNSVQGQRVNIVCFVQLLTTGEVFVFSNLSLCCFKVLKIVQLGFICL